MKFKQRDVVWLNDSPALPDGIKLDHPVLIISCGAANSKENFYTTVMMTASSYTDRYTFPLENNMFERPLEKKGCQLRLYIIVSVRESQIRKLTNRMKYNDFKAVLRNINDYVFCPDSQ